MHFNSLIYFNWDFACIQLILFLDKKKGIIFSEILNKWRYDGMTASRLIGRLRNIWFIKFLAVLLNYVFLCQKYFLMQSFLHLINSSVIHYRNTCSISNTMREMVLKEIYLFHSVSLLYNHNVMLCNSLIWFIYFVF